MNSLDREIMVRAKHVRHLYGGKYEPMQHLAIFSLVLATLAILAELYVLRGFLVSYFLIYTLPMCFSYLWVARLKKVGSFSSEQFSNIIQNLEKSAERIKSKGKFSIELINQEGTHIMAFYHQGSIYASAFKYLHTPPLWLGNYAPFFSGSDEIRAISKIAENTNKSNQPGTLQSNAPV